MFREGTFAKADSKKIHIQRNRINFIRLNSFRENGEPLQTTQTNLENCHSTESLNKMNNFIKALEVMKMKKVELKKILSNNSMGSFVNSETERNVMEVSITNANLSKEENVVRYLNNPVIKNVQIIHNNIEKKRKFNHNSHSARIPYKMEVQIRPFQIMEAIEEKEESEENQGMKIGNSNSITKSNNSFIEKKNKSANRNQNVIDQEFCDSLDKEIIRNGLGRTVGEVDVRNINSAEDSLASKGHEYKHVKEKEEIANNYRKFSPIVKKVGKTQNPSDQTDDIGHQHEHFNSNSNIDLNLNTPDINNDTSREFEIDTNNHTQLEEDSLCIRTFKAKCEKLQKKEFLQHTNSTYIPQRIKQRAVSTANTYNRNYNYSNSNSNANQNTMKNNITSANTNTNTFTITSKPHTSDNDLNLDDLDEVKEINLVDYQVHEDSLNKKLIKKKKLNVSELDVFKNYNVEDDFSQSSFSNYLFSSRKKIKNNKNSKILIVDSVIKSADSILVNKSNQLNQMKKTKIQKEKHYKNSKNVQNDNADKKTHGYSNSTNVNNLYNRNHITGNNKNLSNSRENQVITSSNKKTVRRKYFKSEIFESYGKYSSNFLDKSDRFDTGLGKNSKITKNLLNKFNEIEVVVDKNFECLNLVSDDENTIDRENSSRPCERKNTIEFSQGINTDDIELVDIQTISEFDNISCNRRNFNEFQTPKDKIRNHNCIGDILILAMYQNKNKNQISGSLNTSERGVTGINQQTETLSSNFLDEDDERYEKKSGNSRKSMSINSHNLRIVYANSARENSNRINGKINKSTDKSITVISICNNYKENRSNCIEEEDSFADKVYDLSFVKNMLEREKVYQPDASYLNKHPKLDASHRTILIDWLMELCEEFAFKRDTFHYAVYYIDRFLSNVKDISKGSLQLIGVASLSIAAKFEEIQLPKTDEYINATDNSYSIDEFMKTERYILQSLKWQIIPITINTWLNWYLFQWDLFVDTISEVKDLITTNSKELIYFKKPDENYYFYYRQVTQMIDAFTIDYESLKISDRFLIAAAMFLTICSVWEIEQFTKENLNKFDYDEDFFLGFVYQKDSFAVRIFSQFLKDSLNMEFDDPTLIKALTYAVLFLGMDFNYNLPLVIQSNNGDIVKIFLYIFLIFNRRIMRTSCLIRLIMIAALSIWKS